MLCQKCKKNQATINFVEKINGDSYELHLCDYCYAQTYGQFEEEANNALLNGLFDETPSTQTCCEVCGMSFEEFQKTGLLGCASCYDVFKKELMPYIERIQGKTVHVGLKGGDYYTEHELRRRLKDMQDELEGALKRGDYIYAGKLNARMQAIKKQLTGGTKNE